MLIPYYRLALATENDPIQIDQIFIGPTPHSRQSRHSLHGCLYRHDLQKTKIVNSATPFRNW
jgi:hypothetical protein